MALRGLGMVCSAACVSKCLPAPSSSSTIPMHIASHSQSKNSDMNAAPKVALVLPRNATLYEIGKAMALIPSSRAARHSPACDTPLELSLKDHNFGSLWCGRDFF